MFTKIIIECKMHLENCKTHDKEAEYHSKYSQEMEARLQEVITDVSVVRNWQDGSRIHFCIKVQGMQTI